MAESLTILKNDPDFFPDLDFNLLREEGISYLSQFSGRLWTDHNLHDPGITILEMLCYALTDLGYRNNLPIEDLIALQNPNTDIEDNFFSPAEILTNNPLTVVDYRKLLIDIDGVKNAWLLPAKEAEVKLYVHNCCCGDDATDSQVQLHYESDDSSSTGGDCDDANCNCGQIKLNGLYTVCLELDALRISNDESCEEDIDKVTVGEVVEEARRRLNQHRNLCEDFLDIKVLGEEEIAVCTDIELEPDGDPEDVIVEILLALQAFISPSIRFYTLQEMIQRGTCIEDIFKGRPLSPPKVGSKGFIDTAELLAVQQQTEFHVSDFYGIIMGIPGVQALKTFRLINYIDGIRMSNGAEWCLKLTEGYTPVFSFDLSKIRFFKGTILLTVDAAEVNERIQARISNITKADLDAHKLDLAVPQGTYRPDLADYYSIQNEFPATYKIGKGELPLNATVKRKAQAYQLKGYLTFFDQILANYLTQLNNIRPLFSITPDDQRDAELNQSFFTQELNSVPDIQKLILFHDLDEFDNFDQGERIALSPEQSRFESALEREQAILRLIATFEVKNIAIKTIETEEGFSFQIENSEGQLVLEGSQFYEQKSTVAELTEVIDFLGALPESYRPINDYENQCFSFELIYNPISYVRYLKRISEDLLSYQRRRDTFLNHLLARFSETFTEYVLLMYALNGERFDQNTILNDKANFLSCYPEISRNRGKAYDYTEKNSIWNSENISGFEKRVAKLMGIRDHERRSLGKFEIAIKDEAKLELKNRCGETLFITEQSFPVVEGTAKPEEEEQFITLLENYGNFQDFSCTASERYGFYLQDEEGKVYANHPCTYPTPARRDQKKEELHALINCGFLIEVSPCKGKFHFLMFDDCEDCMFISELKFDTKKEARLAYYDFLQLLWNIENFTIDEKPSQEEGESIFCLAIKDINSEYPEQTIAYQPSNQCSATQAEAEAEQERIHHLIKRKKLYHDFPETESEQCYRWEWTGISNGFAMHSFATYETEASYCIYADEEQLTRGFLQFLEAACTSNRYLKSESCGCHFLYILDNKGNTIARSSDFDQLKDCEAAISTLQSESENILSQLNIEEGQDIAQTLLTQIAGFYFEECETTYKIEITDHENEVLFRSYTCYFDRDEAIADYICYLELACDWNNYNLIADHESSCYSFELVEGEEILFLHPMEYATLQEAKWKLKAIIHYIKCNKCPAEISKLWCFYLLGESCSCSCEDEAPCSCCEEEGCQCQPRRILQGLSEPCPAGEASESASNFCTEEEEWEFTAKYCTAQEAWEAAAEYKEKLMNGQVTWHCESLEGEGNVDSCSCCYYGTLGGNKILGGKLKCCSKEGETYVCSCDKILNCLNTIGQGITTSFDCILQNTTAYDGQTGTFQTGFRLVDEDFCLAYHPTTYPSKEERLAAICAIHEKAICGDPPYIPYSYSCQTFRKETGSFHFAIYYETHMLWQSTKGYDTADIAKEAGEAIWFELLWLARDQSNYQFQGGSVVLQNQFEQVIAQLPDEYSDTTQADLAINERIDFAVYYPIVQSQGQYLIRIYGTYPEEIHWVGQQQYETLDEAIEAYRLLLDLIQYKPNFQFRNDEHACLFGFDLGEVLLEGTQCFEEEVCLDTEDGGGTATPSCSDIPGDQDGDSVEEVLKNLNAWKFEGGGVNAFIRFAQNEEAYYPYVTNTKDCSYSFRVVEGAYRVAFHPTYYNTLEERELALDRIYEKLKCEVKASQIDCCVICKEGKYFYQIKDALPDGAGSQWISYQGYSSAAQALDFCNKYRIRLLQLAREPDFYTLMVDGQGRYSVLLVDENCQAIAQMTGLYTDTDTLLEAVVQRILFARFYPITLVAGGYGFQIYCASDLVQEHYFEHPLEGKGDFPCGHSLELAIPGEIAWRNVQVFRSEAAAVESVMQLLLPCWSQEVETTEEDGPGPKCSEPGDGKETTTADETDEASLPLLCLKTNILGHRVEECGPFSFELVNPAEVAAEHPRTYKNLAAVHQAIDRTRACVSAEGFHLVEHILLRPRNGRPDESYYSICWTDETVARQALINRPFADSEQAYAEIVAFWERICDITLDSLELLLNPPLDGEMLTVQDVYDSLLLESKKSFPVIDASILAGWLDILPLEEVFNAGKATAEYFIEMPSRIDQALDIVSENRNIAKDQISPFLKFISRRIKECILSGIEDLDILRSAVRRDLGARFSSLGDTVGEYIDLGLITNSFQGISSFQQMKSRIKPLPEIAATEVLTILDTLGGTDSTMPPNQIRTELAEKFDASTSFGLHMLEDWIKGLDIEGYLNGRGARAIQNIIRPSITQDRLMKEIKRCLLEKPGEGPTGTLPFTTSFLIEQFIQKILAFNITNEPAIVEDWVNTLQLDEISPIHDNNIRVLLNAIEQKIKALVQDPRLELEENQRNRLEENLLDLIKEFLANNISDEERIINCLKAEMKTKACSISCSVIEELFQAFDFNAAAGMSLLESIIQFLDEQSAFEMEYLALRMAIGRNQRLQICNSMVEQIKDKLLPINADCEDAVKTCKDNAFSDPCSVDELCDCVCFIPGADPYSYWMTLVLPFWPSRFQNTDFRAFFEETIRREAPAHIALKICWIDPCQMAQFEEKFCNWLQALSGSQQCNFAQSHCDMIECISGFRNIYPPSRLLNCGNLITENAMIINRATLS